MKYNMHLLFLGQFFLFISGFGHVCAVACKNHKRASGFGSWNHRQLAPPIVYAGTYVPFFFLQEEQALVTVDL